MTSQSSPGSAVSLIARADKYLNTGSGEYASDIMRDMAEFIRRLPAAPAQSSADSISAVARAICLATFRDEAIHGDARCCQVGGKDGCCVEEIKPQAIAAIEAMNGVAQPSAGTGSAAASPLAYRLDHPTYGIDLSIRRPAGDWTAAGWTVTPLYGALAQSSLDPAQEARNLDGVIKYINETSARFFEPNHVVSCIGFVRDRLAKASQLSSTVPGGGK